MSLEIKIVSAGLFSTIQDEGRSRSNEYGIPESGYLDSYSAQIANILVGNPSNSPILECILTAPKLEFKGKGVIAFVGAKVEARLNGLIVSEEETIVVNTGDKLEFGKFERGNILYIAVAGRWEVSEVLGSYSTLTLANFGGLEGRAFKSGDTIMVYDSESPKREISLELKRYLPYQLTVRVIEGIEWENISIESRHQFLNSSYKISSKSNRMGIRLEGVPVPVNGLEIKSSAACLGMIQLPPNGLPIILMKDGQTVGGYPRVAKIIDCDISRVAQLRAGDQISFELISIKKALQINKEFEELFESFTREMRL